MKKEISLDEAKKYYFQKDIIVDGDHFIKPPLQSSQRPNITMEISTLFTINEEGQPQSDEQFRSFPEYTNGMKMDFQGEPEVLFGKYREGENGPVFSITDPKEAEQVMIRVGWGYEYYSDESFDGQGPDSEEAKSALHFERLNYGNDQGADYYIVGVGHVLGEPDRDASQYLEEMSDQIAQEEKMYDAILEEAQEQYQHDKSAVIDLFQDLKAVAESSPLPKEEGLMKAIMNMEPSDERKGLWYPQYGDYGPIIPFDLSGIRKIDLYIDMIEDVSKNLPLYKQKMEQYKEELSKYGATISECPLDFRNPESIVQNRNAIAGTIFQVNHVELRLHSAPDDFTLTEKGMRRLKDIADMVKNFEMERKKQTQTRNTFDCDR